MAIFILRVQLNVETNKNYTWVRDRLLEIGFTKRVTSIQGVEYRLPNGNYKVETDKSDLDVLTAVQNIVYKIDKKAMLLVVELKEKGMAWAGLQIC